MDIHSEMKKYGIEKYTILDDGSVHAHQDVKLSNRNLTKIPFNFYKIDGGFLDIRNNQLTSFEGIPQGLEVLYISNNQLTSFKGCPKGLKKLFVGNNQLTSFECCPPELKHLNISNNKITSLKGCPTGLNTLYISYNQLTSLEGCPEKPKYWYGNPIHISELIKLVKEDPNDNWKKLSNVQDKSSKEKVLELLQYKLEIINLISQNDTSLK